MAKSRLHSRGTLSGSNDGVAAVDASKAEIRPMPRELALAAQNKAKH